MVWQIPEGTVLTSICLPADLHRRSAIVCKRLRTSRSQLIREALDEKVIELEGRFKREYEERLAMKSAKRMEKINRFGIPIEEAQMITGIPSRDPLENLYREHAKHVLEAGDDKEEIHRRAAEAIAAVQRARPLTHPPEGEILIALEKHILSLKKINNNTTRTFDQFVGQVVAPNIPTHGDVEPEPEPEPK